MVLQKIVPFYSYNRWRLLSYRKMALQVLIPPPKLRNFLSSRDETNLAPLNVKSATAYESQSRHDNTDQRVCTSRGVKGRGRYKEYLWIKN